MATESPKRKDAEQIGDELCGFFEVFRKNFAVLIDYPERDNQRNLVRDGSEEIMRLVQKLNAALSSPE